MWCRIHWCRSHHSKKRVNIEKNPRIKNLILPKIIIMIKSRCSNHPLVDCAVQSYSTSGSSMHTCTVHCTIAAHDVSFSKPTYSEQSKLTSRCFDFLALLTSRLINMRADHTVRLGIECLQVQICDQSAFVFGICWPAW